MDIFSFSLAFNFQKRLLASLVKSVKEGRREEVVSSLPYVLSGRKKEMSMVTNARVLQGAGTWSFVK